MAEESGEKISLFDFGLDESKLRELDFEGAKGIVESKYKELARLANLRIITADKRLKVTTLILDSLSVEVMPMIEGWLFAEVRDGKNRATSFLEEGLFSKDVSDRMASDGGSTEPRRKKKMKRGRYL